MTKTELQVLAYGIRRVEALIVSLTKRVKEKGKRWRKAGISRRQHLKDPTVAARWGAMQVQRMLLSPLGDLDLTHIDDLDVMTPDHPRWAEFTRRMGGSEGLNFRKDKKGRTQQDCDHTHDVAKRILKKMGCHALTSLSVFVEHGGYCDCEILYNVEAGVRRGRRPRRGKPKRGRGELR